MWGGRRSLWLSKLATLMFIAALAAIAVFAPWLARRVVYSPQTTPLFLATIYSGCAAALVLLLSLYGLLKRIEHAEVFVKRNVAALRLISWSCMAGACICLASSFYYFPWLAIAIAAAFMGLIVRVVKNVVAQAVALQDEADYTV